MRIQTIIQKHVRVVAWKDKLRLGLTMTEMERLQKENKELKEENETLTDVLEAFNEMLIVQDDVSLIFERILIKPMLCVLLKKELHAIQIANLTDSCSVVQVDYENEKRFAIVLVLHQVDPERETELLATFFEE